MACFDTVLHDEAHPLALGVRLNRDAVRERSWGDWLRACMRTTVRAVRDERTPQWRSIVDVRDGSCPREPLPLDETWRVDRRGRRNPAGSNLNADQALLRCCCALAAIDGDPAWRRPAEDYVRHVCRQLRDDKGMLWWGWHRHVDLFTGEQSGHLQHWHELHGIEDQEWALLWELEPEAVRSEIAGIWQWHVADKDSFEIDRHDSGRTGGCNFAMTAAAHIKAFAFLAAQGEGEHWRERAWGLAEHYFLRRSAITGLPPERPNAEGIRFDARVSPTTIPGPFCHGLLRAGEYLDDERFTARAVDYLLAYDRFAWDGTADSYWANIDLDGRPVIVQGALAEGYDISNPHGHVDLWQPYAAGYEHPLAAAQSYAYAYERSGDERLLLPIRRWAALIERSLPAGPCTREPSFYQPYAEHFAPHGAYAGHYARAIGFFLHAGVLCGERAWVATAETIAADALSKLWYDDLLRGHPGKPYYEAIDGVGQLLQALCCLDRVTADIDGTIAARGVMLPDGSRLRLDVWP